MRWPDPSNGYPDIGSSLSEIEYAFFFCRLLRATTGPILYTQKDHRQAGAHAGARPPIGVNMDGLNTNSAAR